ncbi:hypothetical protein SmJEL517_g04034 [Synchytrium microbalum]|uniref:Asp/Glu/hydantoin racemase n=1 Tax=Synchytrium microbalum TaxID=1806994 RepID=A0A507C1P7_9FUNG|nr:uncharacterized protein SmJEL517_g04034 [Synchytrium microbalum]TPX32989.1 hypothetical protein SmJEL517_g04034 [Synchytrium microbalum]
MKEILVINPNTTVSMTRGIERLISYFTAPSGVSSINNEDDAKISALHCLPHLESLIEQYDAFLIACYSRHPLVSLLKSNPRIISQNKLVTGIFEASISHSLQLVSSKEKFGIVSTSKVYEELLSDAVHDFLGSDSCKWFGGVETTGLNASELEHAPDVRSRMKETTKRLVRRGDIGAICLGCAGMADMDNLVREACIEEMGVDKGSRIFVVDGIISGLAFLDSTLSLRARPQPAFAVSSSI